MTAATKSKGRSKKPKTFEQAMKRLQEIVERLEQGELPLEETIRLFEEGMALARSTQKQLDEAEKRIEELLAVDEDGTPETVPFEESR